MEAVLNKLGMSPQELMRKKEPIYNELSLGDPTHSNQYLIQAMAENPKLIERPIFVVGDKAKLGRPKEQVLELLN